MLRTGLPAIALLALSLAQPASRQDAAPMSHARPALPGRAEIAKLPPDGGPRWNRLVFEKSPYLLQHAGNPVDWWPWGEAAFAAARAQDKPVFLSIGYATCHWCHVMERESFENDEISALLNAAFVCVKVDREERPDIDQVYMTVTQALTGSGGWPMTVVLAPDRRPFFAGTYFPPDGGYGRPGMRQLVPALADAWKSHREDLLARADRITDALAELSSGQPGDAPTAAALDAGRRQLASRFDERHAGFGSSPKFPTPHQLSFLLREHRRTGDAKALEMADRTLRALRHGGIFDHVGLGLHRYSTDAEWLAPHFEKMLYDQALLLVASVEAWEVTGREEHARTARETAAYVLRDMTSPEGGFYSAEDADSEGEEGRFYLWSPAAVQAALGAEDAAWWCGIFDVTESGNFRDPHSGKSGSIPRLRRPLAEVAAALGTSEDGVRARAETLRAKLFAARERRVHPLKDDKVLTDWNGLMIAALARSGAALGEPRHVEAAQRAADFALERLRTPEGRLLKRWRDGEAGLPAHLEDHAFLAWGLVELHQATLDPRWLREALAVTELAVARFWDAEAGGFFMTADDGEPLLVRAKDAYDGALPSGNSVMALNLARLARLTGRADLEAKSRATLEAFAGSLAQQPSAHCFMLQALAFLLGPTQEVVVAGRPGADDTRALLAAFRKGFRPNAVLLLRPPGDDAELAPFTKGLAPVDGRAAAYVCTNFACQRPVTEPADLAAALR